MCMVVSKLPINVRESLIDFIERLSDVFLFAFRDWLQQKTAVHERFMMSITFNNAQMEKSGKFCEPVLASNVVKTSSSTVSSNVRKYQFPLCDESNKIWKCSVFWSKSVKQRYAFIREKQLCFTCLQSGHITRGCLSKKKC